MSVAVEEEGGWTFRRVGEQRRLVIARPSRKDATEGDPQNEHHGVVNLVEHARGRVAHSVGRSRVGRVASNGKRRAAASSESAI